MAVIVRKVRDRFRDLLQTHGSPAIKQKLWDEEFANGRWDHLEATANDCVYSRIERWAQKGSILDLGCGSGATANELTNDAFREYTGVDISEVALAKAKKRTVENGRASKCHFMQGDVVHYVPKQKVDVILFRESVYYIKRPQLKAVLTRYAQWLTSDGVFIVRIWNEHGKLKGHTELIENNFEVLDQYRHKESGTAVLVFRAPDVAMMN